MRLGAACWAHANACPCRGGNPPLPAQWHAPGSCDSPPALPWGAPAALHPCCVALRPWYATLRSCCARCGLPPLAAARSLMRMPRSPRAGWMRSPPRLTTLVGAAASCCNGNCVALLRGGLTDGMACPECSASRQPRRGVNASGCVQLLAAPPRPLASHTPTQTAFLSLFLQRPRSPRTGTTMRTATGSPPRS